jgi:hypothetical protein
LDAGKSRKAEKKHLPRDITNCRIKVSYLVLAVGVVGEHRVNIESAMAR